MTRNGILQQVKEVVAEPLTF